MVNDECLIMDESKKDNISDKNKIQNPTSKIQHSKKWYIVDHDGNPVEPAPDYIQTQITSHLSQLTSHSSPLTSLPLITVITVVYNGEKYLEETIQSVINQTYPNVEYIIIDGGSTDGTLDIIKKYEDYIDYWVSEKDNGIYDAMNKGVDVALGKWVYFLGSGDIFYSSHVLKSIFIDLKDLGSAFILFGDIIYDDGRLFKSRYGTSLYYRNTIHHQGAFYRRKLFDKFRYQSNYIVSADYELNLMLFCNKNPSLNVKIIIAKCNNEGISNQVNLRGYIEEIEIRHKYLGRINLLKYDLLTLLRYLIKRFSKNVLLRK
ncbi:glycosyltransferase [Deferribacteraceae bacterium V6Fe1]|nr:glycosyltransferase [Deferribacteraceae bacterium V6Fe1]